jgi:hypothetical protein
MAFVGDENANNFNKNRYSADRQGEEGVTKGIYRIDDEIGYNYGWFVCLNRASGRFNLMFRDNIYGGKESALIAAQDWYDKKVLECPIMPRVNRVSIIRKNNQSGMAGVYRWPADGRLEKNAYWAAKWVETAGTKPVAKKFSISRYGEDVAKLLAIAARENALACCID